MTNSKSFWIKFELLQNQTVLFSWSTLKKNQLLTKPGKVFLQMFQKNRHRPCKVIKFLLATTYNLDWKAGMEQVDRVFLKDST